VAAIGGADAAACRDAPTIPDRCEIGRAGRACRRTDGRIGFPVIWIVKIPARGSPNITRRHASSFLMELLFQLLTKQFELILKSKPASLLHLLRYEGNQKKVGLA
jgi:hypothetical protein